MFNLNPPNTLSSYTPLVIYIYIDSRCLYNQLRISPQKLLTLRPKMFFFQLGQVKKIYLVGGSPSATYSTYVRLGVTILLPVLNQCELGQPRFPFTVVCLLFSDVIYILFTYEIVLKSKHNNYCLCYFCKYAYELQIYLYAWVN